MKYESVLFEVRYLPCPYNEIYTLNINNLAANSQISVPTNLETKYNVNLTSKHSECPIATTLTCRDSSSNEVEGFSAVINSTAQAVFTVANNIQL